MTEVVSRRWTVTDVTFAQLRTFACAARTGSFVDAAEALGISQPAVSEQIRALEERLGRGLFLRRRGTTPVLTPEGEQVAETVEAILASYENLFGPGQPSVAKELIRISMGPFLREQYFRALLPRIYRDYPAAEIVFEPTFSLAETTRLLENGGIDLAIYSSPIEVDLPPFTRPICELPMVMVARPGTRARLAAGERTLNDFQYIFPVHRDVGGRWARKCLRNLGLTPSVQPIFVELIDSLADMVEEGQGIGYLMTGAVAGRIAAGRIEVLDVPLTPMRRVIARSPHASELVRMIESLLCEVLALSPEEMRERFD